MKKNTGKYIGFIAISVLISWLLAISVNLDKYELGALFNMVIPIVIGVFSIVLFLMLNLIKGEKIK
jgi:hypothetical protein